MKTIDETMRQSVSSSIHPLDDQLASTFQQQLLIRMKDNADMNFLYSKYLIKSVESVSPLLRAFLDLLSIIQYVTLIVAMLMLFSMMMVTYLQRLPDIQKCIRIGCKSHQWKLVLLIFRRR